MTTIHSPLFRSRPQVAAIEPLHLPWAGQRAGASEAALAWRERLVIRIGRAQRWEFWPTWLVYLPIVGWILWLGLRHRGFTVFTAANPALEAGGLVGEPKHEALAPLQANAPDLVAPFLLLRAGPARDRIAQARAFAARHDYPLVLKPNIGQRGRGVHIARNAAVLAEYLMRFHGDVIVQRYVPGEEFGIFIARRPGDAQLQVLSVVNKVFPRVFGNGRSTLRELILADPRARLIAERLFARWAGRLREVLPHGSELALVEIGAHSRGSVFLDARSLVTPALQRTLTRLADAVPGYHFGRIDLRVPSAEQLCRGEGIQVLELNGVAAESAHVYHPGTPLLAGYRALFHQWALAFRIGAANARAGAPVTPAVQLLARFRADLRRARQWF